MGNQEHADKIKRNFGAFSFAYDKGVALGGLSERSGIRKESMELLNTKKGETVYDICCGTGLNFKLLEDHIGEGGVIVGIDLTSEMLDVAKLRCDNLDSR